MFKFEPVDVFINPTNLTAEVQRVLTEVAVNEMGWPAQQLISNIVAGKPVSVVDFVAVKGSEVIGATKVVLQRPFPVELEFPAIIPVIDGQQQLGSVVEVALTGVAKAHRGDRGVMLSIYRALYRWSLLTGVVAWTSIQERQITRLYRILGMPFDEIGEGHDYWCGMSYACIMKLVEGQTEMARRNRQLLDFFEQEA